MSDKLPTHNDDFANENMWQAVSNATGSIVAPANGVTAVGTWLTLDGIDHAGTYRGAVEQIAGRSLDMGDGWVARGTGTASDLGEAFDAGTDALEVLYAGTKRSTYEMLTPLESTWFVGQKLVNIVATGVAKARGQEIHPTKTGKHTSAALSVTYFGRSLARAFESHGRMTAASKAHKLARFTTRASIVLGVPASLGYLADAQIINDKAADAINAVNDSYADTVNTVKGYALSGIRKVRARKHQAQPTPPLNNRLLG